MLDVETKMRNKRIDTVSRYEKRGGQEKNATSPVPFPRPTVIDFAVQGESTRIPAAPQGRITVIDPLTVTKRKKDKRIHGPC